LTRLIAAGKPAKVALTAVMRKLIVLMNHLHDGALLVTEDGNGTLWRIAYTGH
jgi:glucose/arabinose dehydrogenase